MFDTSIVKAHAIAAPRRTTLVISILIHSVAVVAAVGLSVTSAQTPPEPPRQLELYRPVEAPPAPPGPPIGRSPEPVRQQESPPKPEEVTPPAEIPDQTQIAVPQSELPGGPEGPADGPIGDPEGDKNGVPGGVPGGKGVTPGGEGTQTTPYTPGALGVTSARVIKRVEPRFPEPLIHAVNRATVVVFCVIGKDGRIRDPRIVSSTFEPFNAAVIDALRQWEFEPGRLRGEPVDTYFELTVKFEVRR